MSINAHHTVLDIAAMQMSDKIEVKADSLAAAASGLKKTTTVEKNVLPSAE